MKKFTKTDVDTFLTTETFGRMGRAKTRTRVIIDNMKLGDSVLLERGVDYEYYRNVYYCARDSAKSDQTKFTVKVTADRKKVLVTRIK